MTCTPPGCLCFAGPFFQSSIVPFRSFAVSDLDHVNFVRSVLASHRRRCGGRRRSRLLLSCSFCVARSACARALDFPIF